MSAPTAVVTGGAGGLGRVIVDYLARDRDVIVLDVVHGATSSKRVMHVTVDLRDGVGVADAVNRAAAEVGAPAALVSCAGVGPSYQRALELDAETFHRAFDVNVFGVLNACRAVVPMMQERGWGRIVNISSVTATGGWVSRSEYAASKAALESLSASLAVELGPSGITVNCVAPGHMRTAMTAGGDIPWEPIVARTALGRLVKPEDVAQAVAFLLDERAGGITGTVLRVDAGYLANQLIAINPVGRTEQ